MTRSKNCCNSTKHDSNCVKSCVEHEIIFCKEKCCKAKYVKLAEKLLKTGLLVDSCTYNRDVFTNVVAGSKFEWLNSYLINSDDPTDFSPASYGSENAFRTVDPTLDEYIFLVSVTQNALLNPTSQAGTAIPLVQDVLQYILGAKNFGTNSLNQIIANPANSAATKGYAVVFTNAIRSAGNAPVNQVIIGAPNIPLFCENIYNITLVDGSIISKVSKIGLIKKDVEGDIKYYIYGVGHRVC